MRKFRNAALAAATATAVAFGGTAIANAEDTTNGGSSQASIFTGSSKQDGDSSLSEFFKKGREGQGSSGYGDALDADTPARASDFYGKQEGTNMPQWARVWRDTINFFAYATVIGAVIGAGNWALNRGYLPQIPFNFNVQLPF